jgi:hypothetical protein
MSGKAGSGVLPAFFLLRELAPFSDGACARSALQQAHPSPEDTRMNRISAIALAVALGCAGSVYAASQPQDSSASNTTSSTTTTTTHQVGSDLKSALHKMGAATRNMLHRAGSALHRVSHRDSKSASQS